MFDALQSTNHILVYRFLEGEPLDRFAAGMLQNKKLKHFLLVSMTAEGEQPVLRIPVGGLVPLPEWLVNCKDPRGLDILWASLLAANWEREDILLPTEDWLLHPQFTFVEQDTGEVRFLLLPTPFASCLQNTPREFLREAAAYCIGTSLEESALRLLRILNDPSVSDERLWHLAETPLPEEKPAVHQPKNPPVLNERVLGPQNAAPPKPEKKKGWKEKLNTLINGTEA